MASESAPTRLPLADSLTVYYCCWNNNDETSLEAQWMKKSWSSRAGDMAAVKFFSYLFYPFASPDPADINHFVGTKKDTKPMYSYFCPYAWYLIKLIPSALSFPPDSGTVGVSCKLPFGPGTRTHR